jgi:hypothetical protein
MYQIFPVDKKVAAAPEQLGSKSKFWYLKDGRKLLFKAEERGTGEDWAEKIGCHICELLGLPHVDYELAELFDGDVLIQPGVICETCAPPPVSLILGNQLLLAIDGSYPAHELATYKVRAHTVSAVAEVISVFDVPPKNWLEGLPEGITSALDIFVGYVMLDAWIANQDRHHENWGALWDQKNLRLAPTFDHGAAFARNLLDAERSERLLTLDRNRTVEFFARRARSGFYGAPTDKRSLSTMETFKLFSERAPVASKLWLDKLEGIQQKSVDEIVAQIPERRMSGIAKAFTVELLKVNKRHLLENRIK